MSGKALDILLLKLKSKNPANLKATLLEGNADLLAFEHCFISSIYSLMLFCSSFFLYIKKKANPTDSASFGGERQKAKVCQDQQFAQKDAEISLSPNQLINQLTN